MYQSSVPLMVIRTDSPALIQVNGQMLGECGEGGYVALPVSESGDYYVCALPLRPLRYGVTRKFSFAEGRMGPCGADDVSLCAWPGGVYECHMKIGLYPSAPRRRFPRTLDSCSYGGYALTLYVEELLRLSVEQGGKPYCSFCLGEGESAAMAPWGGFLSVSIYGERGMRLVLLNESLDFVLDVEAGTILLDEAGISCIDPLHTRRGHERRVRYIRAGEGCRPAPAETGFFTHSPGELCTPLDIATAFFEAVRENLADEAMGYLSASLRESVDFGAIRDFLGDFQRVEPPLSDGSGSLMGLIQERGARLYSASLYQLSFEEGKIDNIAEL